MAGDHPWLALAFVITLGLLAACGMAVGGYLAVNDYSSAGAFSVSSACVGVLGTLGAQRIGKIHHERSNHHGRDD